MSRDSFTARVWRSDTKQIARFSKEGRLEVTTPRLRMLAGELKPGKLYALGGLRMSVPTPIAGIVAYSLDGKSLEQSRRWVIKMVTQAENTGQKLEPPTASGKRWRLSNTGTAPVITRGKPSAIPIKVWLTPSGAKIHPNAPLLTLYLQNGTWELVVENGTPRLICDTPGIRTKLSGKEFVTP
jgi:hypothetical protein